MNFLRNITETGNAFLRSIFPPQKHTEHAQHYDHATLLLLLDPVHRDGHTALMPRANETVKHFLGALKYEKHARSIRTAASLLRDWLDDEYREQTALRSVRHLLCTVPKRKNGYNHLHAILAELFGMYRNTQIRDGRNLLQWKEPSAYGTMWVSAKIPKHTVCIVLDDSILTGAGLSEARRALTEHGAEEVITIALAY